MIDTMKNKYTVAVHTPRQSLRRRTQGELMGILVTMPHLTTNHLVIPRHITKKMGLFEEDGPTSVPIALGYAQGINAILVATRFEGVIYDKDEMPEYLKGENEEAGMVSLSLSKSGSGRVYITGYMNSNDLSDYLTKAYGANLQYELDKPDADGNPQLCVVYLDGKPQTAQASRSG